MSFRPKVLAATPGEELRWLGKLGFHGIADGEHFFILTTNDDGTTRLNHGERFPARWSRLRKAAQGTVALPMKHSVRPSNNASSISTDLETASCVEAQGCRDASRARTPVSECHPTAQALWKASE
jgi:hypothetical protein